MIPHAQRLLPHAPREMKIYAVISTLVALLFLALFLGTIPISSGGGQGESSPNGVFVANAASLRNNNPLTHGSRDTYYEFTVTRGHTTPFKRVVMYPSDKNDEMYFRSLPKIVAWAPDSSAVTFTIPGTTLTLDMQNHRQTPAR